MTSGSSETRREGTAGATGRPLEAPWPGSHEMPRWDRAELIDAPVFQSRSILRMLGPGLVMGAAAIGGGEWLAGPAVTAKYGPALLWVATVSILFQVVYNIEISRYTLYTGEPIFTGKLRIPPGPVVWVVLYLLLDWGSVAPYLAANAATPLETLWLGRLPDADKIASDWWLHKIMSTVVYLLAMVPLIVGGKIYNSLKIVMSAKLILVVGFLLFLGVFFTRVSTWTEITSGLFQFGAVPIIRAEDTNGNGILDPGEDFDRDGKLDGVEREYKEGNVTKFEDTDGDKIRDGVNVDNILVALWEGRELPHVDLTLIGVIAALAAIAGNGGLTNTPISNFTRDQGWGMGHHVGAIPSMVGGEGITLSHVGCVFDVNSESLPRWRRWVRHVVREQLFVWLVACLVGVSLPSILSVEFLPRGTDAKDWSGAAMTADGVRKHLSEPLPDVLISQLGLAEVLAGPRLGQLAWNCTLLCGFLVLITSHITTMDGFVRRWVDVLWTASRRLRKLPVSEVRLVYLAVLLVYGVCGLSILWLLDKPSFLFRIATTGYNYAFAFSAWHTIVVNHLLLPRPLRCHWLMSVFMFLSGCYFALLGIVSTLGLMGRL